MRREATASAYAPRARRQAAQRRRARRKEHRLRRFALLVVVAGVAVVTLALTAFGNSSEPVAAQGPAPAQRLLPSGSPQPTAIAKLGDLRLQLPIAPSRVTAVAFHGAGLGALPLEPIGHQGNEGLLARLGHKLFGGSGSGPTWYQIDGGEGPRTSGVDVGAAPGTAVYSPVDGRIVGLTPYIIDGRPYGERIDIQPARAPSVVVSLTHLTALESLSVGSTVTASETRLATVNDLSEVERQSLARYTNDAGNHVAMQVRPAATVVLS